MDLLQPMMVSALLVCGMGAALLGTLKLPLSRRLQIDKARIGALVSLFGFTTIPVILTAGFLTDQAGATASSISKPMVLLGGSALMAVSLAVFARAKNYAAALSGVLLLSAGWATLVNVGNVLTPAAFGGSKAYAFNMSNVFFGLGAFLTPMVIGLLLRRFSFGLTLGLLAAACLAPALLALGTKDIAAASAGPDPGLAAVLGAPILWLCGAALFFYGPLEASIGAWTTTYLAGHGVRETTAANVLSGFWLSFMAGRLIAALTLHEHYKEMLILVLGICSVAVLLLMVLNKSKAVALALPLLAGLVFGPIFPTLIAVLLTHTPEAAHGRAVGFLFAVGGLGWTLIPMLIGIYARRTSVQKALSIGAASAVGLSVVATLMLTRVP